jgi:hypothetical protein
MPAGPERQAGSGNSLWHCFFLFSHFRFPPFNQFISAFFFPDFRFLLWFSAFPISAFPISAFPISAFRISAFQNFSVSAFPADTSCRSIRRRSSVWPAIYVLPVES